MKDCEGFKLFYQPIVDVRTDKIIGAEALLRWEMEPYGLVAPNRFVPFIEQNPCIFELGNWIIERAVTEADEMRKFIPNFMVNVNIAPPQLERPEFRSCVMGILERTGYPAKNLCLELTERCRALSFDFLRQEIAFFQKQGVRIAMDDFGTGNASLQMVLELPADEIKIDRSFIQNIQEHKINQVLVEGIAQGAHTISAEICIEGIEDKEVGEYLQRYNPTYYQGYYYSKPVPKDEFMKLIEKEM